MLPEERGMQMAQGSVLCRDRQGGGLGDLVRLEQQLTGEEMKERLGLKAPSRELQLPRWQHQSEGLGEKRSSLRQSTAVNSSFTVFQTCLSCPSLETLWEFISKRKTNRTKQILFFMYK